MAVTGTPIDGTTPTSLELTFEDLYTEVADYLGYGRNPSGARLTEARRYANEGYLRFLLGADPRTDLPPGGRAYDWSFLAPAATITFWAAATGTVSGTPGYGAGASTVTATESKFYASMVGHAFTFDSSGNEYTITAYTSATQVSVSGDASGEASGDTFTIAADGTYSLPNDFGAILDDFACDRSSASARVVHRPVAWIRWRAAGSGASSGIPEAYAIQPRVFDEGVGQRHEVLVDPIPGADYTMHYRYRINPDRMDAADDRPFGGPLHAQALLECVLAVAEERKNDGQTDHQDRARQLLAVAIDLDSRNKPRNLGSTDDAGPASGRRGTVSYI